MVDEEQGPMELMAARRVSFRELSRSTSGVLNEIEKDGKIFAVSRYGRLVALLVPLPERLIVEFEDASPATMYPRHDRRDKDVDLDSLDLSELACAFLIDAASTPTGYWNAPDSAFQADKQQYFRALNDLDFKGLTESIGGGRRITKEGRAVARALRLRGRKGYRELHDEGYHRPQAQRGEGL